jgi:hypothetical protein
VGQDLGSLARVVEFISERTQKDEPVFGFPAMAAVNFLTGRPNPVRHDYFFPGRPAHSEEARVVAELAAVRPAYVVTLNDRFGFFQEAPTYYFLLRDYLQRAYVREMRAGRYDVLRRRDLPEDPTQAAPGAPDAVAAAAGLADLDTLARAGTVDDVPRLLEALRRVHRSLRARVTEAVMAVADRNGGLLPMVRRVGPSEADELMLVRSLGEFGDTRALDYLTTRFAERPTRRMRSETGRAAGVRHRAPAGGAERADGHAARRGHAPGHDPRGHADGVARGHEAPPPRRRVRGDRARADGAPRGGPAAALAPRRAEGGLAPGVGGARARRP